MSKIRSYQMRTNTEVSLNTSAVVALASLLLLPQ